MELTIKDNHHGVFFGHGVNRDNSHTQGNTLQSETGVLVRTGTVFTCAGMRGRTSVKMTLHGVRAADFLLLLHLFLNLFMSNFFVTRVFPGIALA